MKNLKKSDRVFEDLLEDDFVNVLQTSFNIERVLGMLGVNLKYKFITPPTNLYKAYSVFIWLINLICIAYTIENCSSMFDPLSTDIPLKIGMFINGVINASLAWKSSFHSGHFKSQLYVKLQRIERVLKMNNAKHLNRKLYVKCLFWIVFGMIVYCLWLVLSNKYLMRGFCPSVTIATVASSASFITMFHIYTVLMIITLRVQYVNDALARANGPQKKIVSTVNAAVVPKVNVGGELVNGMFCILDSFADTMDVYQHAIFFFTLQLLAWQLITMQNLVVTFKKQMSVNLPSFLCTLPSSMAFMSLMLLLCFASQALVNKLDVCAELCTAVASSLDKGESRENTKRISVLLKGRREATVFDIFTLNTQLPFHLLAVTASYTIVLLQFASL